MDQSQAANFLAKLLKEHTRYKFSLVGLDSKTGDIRVIFSLPTVQEPVSDIVDCDIQFNSRDETKIKLRLRHETTMNPVPLRNIDSILDLAIKGKQIVRTYLQVTA